MSKKKAAPAVIPPHALCLRPGPDGTQCVLRIGHQGGHDWKLLQPRPQEVAEAATCDLPRLKRPAKEPPVKPARSWLRCCPVCMRLDATVRGILGYRPMCRGRTYWWACDDCIAANFLLRADGVCVPRPIAPTPPKESPCSPSK